MTAVAGGAAVDTSTEPGRVDTFFLGASVPIGAQSVVVTRTNNATVMYASAATQTAGGDTEVTGIILLQENQALVQQSVNDGSPGSNSVRYAGAYSGLAAPPTVGANSTLLHNIDLGAFGTSTVRETTAGQGARLVGFTAASDDVAAVHLAVRETPGTAPTVTKSFNLSTIAANSTSTLTVTITNPNSVAINGLAFTDTYPANLVNAATPALSNTCGGTATGAAGAGSLSLTGGTVAGGGSCTVSVSVTSGTVGSYLNSTGAVTSTNAPSGTAASATLTVTAAAPASCGSGAITGVVNTYYPGVASVSAGANSITVGASSGAGTGLAPNDLVLVMQMQDAGIDTSNTGSYGTPGSINAGKYEYATVSSYNGVTGVVTLSANLVNGYTTAAYGATGQKTFQVIRVPAYSTATLGAATAKAWDGSSGGVLAFDVTGTLTLAGATADVSGKGFRGGAGRSLTGLGTGTNADYRTLATNLANGSKGEGIAGTPRYLDNAGVLLDTTVEGYSNGSYAKGAPANAGGGGSDNDGVNNDENTGGGGGANGGAGGMGGYGWSAPASPGRGIGGAAVSSSAGQLVLGGGGGAASTNNATGAPGGGLASSGAAGGGIVMVRAGSLSGTGTINVSGANANNTVTNDGSGGGGAAGSVMVSASSDLSGLTVTANGGIGGTNTGGGSLHGPGGGGGGGYAVTSAALAACNVNGGANGTTFSSSAYGATPGSAGSCTTNASLPSSIPGAALGTGPCVPSGPDHYTIGHSGTGITCEAEPVTFTGHDSSHARADAVGKTISISTNTGSGTWVSTADSCTRTCYNTSGTSVACGNSFTNTVGNNGTASYTFAAGESGIRLCLKQNSAVTQNINITDGTASEASGTAEAGADPNLVFSDTGIRIYADGSVDSIANQIAGVRNDDAANYPSPTQTLTVRALKSGTTTPARCVPLLTSVTRTLQFAYRCESSPSTCSPSLAQGLEVNGTAVTGFNASSTPVPADNISVNFDVNGYGSINLKYFDVGNISLWARATSLADSTTGSTFAVVAGNSNTFAVKPYDFEVIPCAASVVGDCVTPPADPGLAGGGSVFAKAGETFKATITARALGGSKAYSFGRCDSAGGTGCPAAGESVSLASTLAAPSGGAPGTLGGTTSANASSFVASSGAYTFANLNWDEVGVITLKTSNANYLSNGLGACTTQTAGERCQGTFGISGNLGRFIPDHFDVTVNSNGTMAAACASGGFTYTGQAMGYGTAPSLTIKPINAATGSTVTQNYSGFFQKLTAANVTITAPTADGTQNGKDGVTKTVLAASMSTGTLTNSSGTLTYTLAAGDQYTYTRDANALIGAYTSSIPLVVASVSDGEVVSAGTLPTLNPTGVSLRFGRLWLGNAYGSDKFDLAVPFEAQYWNGSAFVKNTNDSCTPLANGNIALGNQQGGLAGYAEAITVSATVNGAGTIILPKPLSDAAGSVDLVVNLGSSGSNCPSLPYGTSTSAALSYLSGKWCGSNYDRDPTARATFGIYGSSLKKGPIYIRESY